MLASLGLKLPPGLEAPSTTLTMAKAADLYTKVARKQAAIIQEAKAKEQKAQSMKDKLVQEVSAEKPEVLFKQAVLQVVRDSNGKGTGNKHKPKQRTNKQDQLDKVDFVRVHVGERAEHSLIDPPQQGHDQTTKPKSTKTRKWTKSQLSAWKADKTQTYPKGKGRWGSPEPTQKFGKGKGKGIPVGKGKGKSKTATNNQHQDWTRKSKGKSSGGSKGGSKGYHGTKGK